MKANYPAQGHAHERAVQPRERAGVPLPAEAERALPHARWGPRPTRREPALGARCGRREGGRRRAARAAGAGRARRPCCHAERPTRRCCPCARGPRQRLLGRRRSLRLIWRRHMDAPLASAAAMVACAAAAACAAARWALATHSARPWKKLTYSWRSASDAQRPVSVVGYCATSSERMGSGVRLRLASHTTFCATKQRSPGRASYPCALARSTRKSESPSKVPVRVTNV